MRTTQRIRQNMAMISDPEVKTPEHDAIMIWLDANIEGILQKRFCPNYDQKHWTEKYLDQVFGEYCKDCEEWARRDSKFERRYEMRQVLPEPPPLGRVTVHRKRWEVPVKREQYVVGFVDMQVEFSHGKHLYISNSSDDPWGVREDRYVCNIEVKPTIASVGELVRQINLYREYLRGIYVVASPDDRWIDVLKSQSISFITCPNMHKPADQLSLPHEP